MTSSFHFLEVHLIPVTKIIGPELASKEVVKRWIEKGWIREEFKEEYEHIDRVFPRDYKGRPYITKEQFSAPLRRLCKDKGISSTELISSFDIVDENKFEVNYIPIPEYPLVQSRAILSIEKNEPKSLETYEYIDSTFRIPIVIKTSWKAAEFAALLAEAGMKYGLFGKTKKGYGRFIIEVRETHNK